MSFFKKLGKKKDEKAKIDEGDAETAATVDKKWDKAADKYRSAANHYEEAEMPNEKNTCLCKACACELNAAFEVKANESAIINKLREATEMFKGLGKTNIELILTTKAKRTYPATNLVAEFTGLATFLEAKIAGNSSLARKLYDESTGHLVPLREAETFAITQLEYLIGRPQVTPLKLALEASARSQWIAADELVENKPEEALGAYMRAITSLEQAGLQDTAEKVRDRYRKTQITRTCYMCGRESTGEGVHFYYYRANAGEYFKKIIEKKGQDPNMVSSQGDSAVLCRVCGSAINFEADSVARVYYQKAMDYVKQLESEIRAEIGEIEKSIRTLSDRISSGK